MLLSNYFFHTFSPKGVSQNIMLKRIWNKNKKLILIIALLLFSIILFFSYQLYKDSIIEEKSYDEFVTLMKSGQIDSVSYSPNKEKMTFITSDGETYKTFYPEYEDFRKDLLEQGITLKKNAELTLTLFLTILELIAICFSLMVFSMLRGGPGKLKSQDIVQESSVTFNDVIGLDEILDDISLYVSMIKNPDIGKDIGARLPKGLLLAGAPGTGKTLIAKAIAGEAGVPFISMSGAEFTELYKGVGAKRVRQVFKIARKNAPCILFIDEIDAIGSARDSKTSDSEDTQTINQLLKEMDGFTSLEGVFLLAATNCPDKLDAALKRSGRFDRQINVNPPREWKLRKELFEFYLKDYKVAEDVNIDTLAKTISGFTGADISMICNEASLVAIMKHESKITMACIEEAIDKKVFHGNRLKSKQYKKEREIVAFHEAGHAVMKYLLGEKISRASIAGTTSGVGGAVFSEEKESALLTKQDILNSVIVCYAGRASELIKYDSATTGAVNDISKATESLLFYIEKYGFDEKIGPVDLELLLDQKIIDSAVINDRILLLAKAQEEKAIAILKENFILVETLAAKLLDEETMSGSEIKHLLEQSGPILVQQKI